MVIKSLLYKGEADLRTTSDAILKKKVEKLQKNSKELKNSRTI